MPGTDPGSDAGVVRGWRPTVVASDLDAPEPQQLVRRVPLPRISTPLPHPYDTGLGDNDFNDVKHLFQSVGDTRDNVDPALRLDDVTEFDDDDLELLPPDGDPDANDDSFDDEPLGWHDDHASRSSPAHDNNGGGSGNGDSNQGSNSNDDRWPRWAETLILCLCVIGAAVFLSYKIPSPETAADYMSRGICLIMMFVAVFNATDRNTGGAQHIWQWSKWMVGALFVLSLPGLWHNMGPARAFAVGFTVIAMLVSVLFIKHLWSRPTVAALVFGALFALSVYVPIGYVSRTTGGFTAKISNGVHEIKDGATRFANDPKGWWNERAGTATAVASINNGTLNPGSAEDDQGSTAASDAAAEKAAIAKAVAEHNMAVQESIASYDEKIATYLQLIEAIERVRKDPNNVYGNRAAVPNLVELNYDGARPPKELTEEHFEIVNGKVEYKSGVYSFNAPQMLDFKGSWAEQVAFTLLGNYDQFLPYYLTVMGNDVVSDEQRELHRKQLLDDLTETDSVIAAMGNGRRILTTVARDFPQIRATAQNFIEKYMLAHAPGKTTPWTIEEIRATAAEAKKPGSTYEGSSDAYSRLVRRWIQMKENGLNPGYTFWAWRGVVGLWAHDLGMPEGDKWLREAVKAYKKGSVPKGGQYPASFMAAFEKALADSAEDPGGP